MENNNENFIILEEEMKKYPNLTVEEFLTEILNYTEEDAKKIAKFYSEFCF